LALENYYLYRLAMWLVTRLPRRVTYFIASLLAEINFLTNRHSRRGIYANHAHVLPPDTGRLERWRIARAAFRNFAYSVIDFFRIPEMNRSNMDQFISEMTGWEHLQATMDAGVGGILITVHMGSWELGGVYLGLRGLPITTVALPHKDHRIDQIYLDNRESSGMEVVPIGGAMRKLQDALLRGRFVALASDRDVSGHGPLLPFFGEVTHVPNGHAKLALRTGAWILPACIYRRPNNETAVEIRPPIVADPARDTVDGLTMRCLSVLEEFIRARPEQWSSFYDLWSKTEKPVA